VARGTQHRKRRPGQNARGNAAVVAPAKAHSRPPQWQDELFFQRLRNHAKIIFFLLALVFALSFVFLGVGSGNGVSDALQNLFTGHGSSGPSISSLQKKTQRNPLDAKAWRDLATAYEQKQRTADAITALKRYVALKPKDDTGLSELASEYTTLARTYATDYQNAQVEAQTISPAATFAPPATSVFGKIYNDPKSLQDPISQLIATEASTKSQTAFSNYTTAQQNAESAFKKLAALTPTDVTVQFQLGQAAQSAGDYPAAAAAYTRFLKLSPEDVDAPQVKQLLQQVEGAMKQSGGSTTTGSG
jgi:Flp pilus assembly protein TadD